MRIRETPRVLVVDDQGDMAKLIAEDLCDHGYDVPQDPKQFHESFRIDTARGNRIRLQKLDRSGSVARSGAHDGTACREPLALKVARERGRAGDGRIGHHLLSRVSPPWDTARYL